MKGKVSRKVVQEEERPLTRVVFQQWFQCITQLCTPTKNISLHISVFYVHTGTKYQYTNWCGQACKFPTSDPSSNQERWHFICVNMFEVPPATLTMELNCSQTATSASSQLSVFHFCRLKCFHRSNFPLPFGSRVYLISHGSIKLMKRSSFPWGNFGLSSVLSGSNWVNRCRQPYHQLSIPVKPSCWYKPPAPVYNIFTPNLNPCASLPEAKPSSLAKWSVKWQVNQSTNQLANHNLKTKKKRKKKLSTDYQLTQLQTLQVIQRDTCRLCRLLKDNTLCIFCNDR